MGVPSREIWNGRDAAADNYAYMVLTASMTGDSELQRRMRDMLRTERRLTRRIGALSDNYRFSTRAFVKPQPVLDEMIFDNAEYVKDGLIPIAEWLGPSPWFDRMTEIMEDIWANAAVPTPYGTIPTRNFEVNGDLLQACSRLYWATGQRKYLEWGARIGDWYLLGTNHPTRDLTKLSLGDHSCEVINGLSELYVAVASGWPEKRQTYQAPMHLMYDRILAVGLDPNGMMWRQVNPITGEVLNRTLTDNWGYNYDGIYTVGLLDRQPAYLQSVPKVLGNLRRHYTGQIWEGGSADGYADSVEGAITLYNREPVPGADEWIDSEIRTMWSKQKPDGVIEGWHGDGNFARTSLMYALWKTSGITLQPWRKDVRLGSVRSEKQLLIHVESDQDWKGRLIFDIPRHREFMRLPLDYPRINQFPEWFVVEKNLRYGVIQDGKARKTVTGGSLRKGLLVQLKAGTPARIRISVPN
jgi:hypothetical protein